MSKQRHSSSIAWIDFLFNLLLAFVCLVVILLMQAQANNSPKAPETKNDFIITAQWDDGTDDDVDLWAQDPSGAVVGFRHRETPGMHLQKDDLGRASKKVYAADGTFTEDLTNIEEIDVTKSMPGQYNVNIHLYRVDPNKEAASDVHITVRVIKTTPYAEVPPIHLTLHRSMVGEEATALNFTVNEKGEIGEVTHLPIPFVLTTLISSTPMGSVQPGDR